MLKAGRNLIQNVLGCGLVVITLSGCSLFQEKEKVEVSITPINKPDLILPKADIVVFRKISWVIITPSNYQEVFKELEKNNEDLVLFGVTDTGYEALATNINDIRSFIQQQQAIIDAYKAYYIQTEESIDTVNSEIEKLNSK